MRRRLLALLLVAALLAGAAVVVILVVDDEDANEPSAASGGAAAPARGVPTPQAVRDCASRVEGGRLSPRPRQDLVAGPIVFYGLRDANRVALRRPSEAFETKNGEYKSVKTITEVRADTKVTVAIAPTDRKRATLFYGLPFPSGRRALGFRLDEGQAVVRFESCPANHRRFSGHGVVGPRTQFNGGFLFTEPQCYRLDVYNGTNGAVRRYVEPYGRPRSTCRA
jgi:hypothetical protein